MFARDYSHWNYRDYTLLCGQGMLTNRRRKELERKKKHRLVLFVEKMREGIIVRRHMAHHICDQIVLQSTVSRFCLSLLEGVML